MIFPIKTDTVFTNQFLGAVTAVIAEICAANLIKYRFTAGPVPNDLRYKRQSNLLWFPNPVMTVRQLPFQGRGHLLHYHIFTVRKHNGIVIVIVISISDTALESLYIFVAPSFGIPIPRDGELVLQSRKGLQISSRFCFCPVECLIVGPVLIQFRLIF